MLLNPDQLRPMARKSLWLAVAAACFHTLPAQAESGETDIRLAPLVVTANPLSVGSDELVVPVAVLSGRELALARESTLGETLRTLPGVSASYFGPNASRPVIRGLDGERVRIMQNGLGILDAASLSFDHAVAVDPLVIEQIDVVRGPAALLYGGSAVGGVVNAIDHRIPQERLDGATGRGEIRFGGPENQKNGVAVLDIGNGLFAVHADAYERKTDDLDIPGYAVSKRKSAADGTPRENRGRLVNSASRSHGGALGASLTFEHGYAGLSYASYDNEYGTVAEEDVIIDQHSSRWDFASEIRELGTLVTGLKLKLAHTDYRHVEIAGGDPETRFRNRGLEGSVEARHGNIGRLSGVIGLQFQDSTFEAIGEEAFVPRSTTRSLGLYLYEELPVSLFNPDDLKLSFGARTENVDVASKGGDRFGAPDSNDFRPRSLAAGALLKLDENWSLSGNLSHSERAPSYFELYAHGPHVATGQFEVGHAGFDEERANGIDTQLRWRSGKHAFSVGAYYTRFSNFIGLFNTGRTVNEEGTPDPAGEYDEAFYRQVAAAFHGFEAEGRFRLSERLGSWDLSLRGDYVRARNRETGEALPRIAPMRMGMGLEYRLNRFGAKVDVLHGFEQDRTSAFELATDSYTAVSAMATYRLPTAFGLELFAKANNLLDDDIRDHTSFLKDIAPQGGRSLLMGVRGEF